jgi:hypothetical protein
VIAWVNLDRMWFWVGRVRFDAKIIDAVAAAGSKFAEFAKRLMRVAGFAFWRGRILWHGWT